MHDIVLKTIDKVSFKINIPILIAIVVGTATIYGSYMTIISKIESISTSMIEHTEQQKTTISVILEQLKENSKDINTLNIRVAVLEKTR